MRNGQGVEPSPPSAGAAPHELEKLTGVEEGDACCCTQSKTMVSGAANGAPPECSHTLRAKPAPVLHTLASRNSSGGAWRLRRCLKAGLAMGVLGGG